MRFLLCPQCGIRRFYVKDSDGNQCLVQVTATYEVVPVNEGDSLEGFNTEIVYCLGCSWSGSVKRLKKY
ncbi:MULTISPECIES: hypothetical protein [Porphyromonadaceae]|uniref:Uncharacterized protein n=1 Tax=Sanguibacteroides justesenii TaxID=1547597 RepID=A0A0C3RG96_9PORP|nr:MULTISPECIES: hypothetical protein [Porphyromonadaceae]KIO44454.1 hypothetical protein BA92_09655 [Sanguibacteroides justesenii]KIO45290.1 hypothetical protein IE90_07675 [Sanguibacteroides justesenii]PXZ44579.1 hypothetical protein DMB45_03820 [Sanguibacteroides justesenii]